MRNIFIAILFIACLVALMGSCKSDSNSTLPPAQRTAIYANAESTRVASGLAASAADAQAVADEQEAARVYAQAQQQEYATMRTLATQQAFVATQVANDSSVAREYATLVAVQVRATSEAISQTMSINQQAYDSRLLEIKATAQATYREATKSDGDSETDRHINNFWKVLWPSVVGVFVVLCVVTAWKLIGLIKPRIEEVEVEVPIVSEREADPQVNKQAGLNFTSADPQVLLVNIVTYSGRHIGWRQQRIAGVDEIGSAITDRAWGSAIEWGKQHYGLATQRGPIKNGGGTYAPYNMAELRNRLILDPAQIPESPPAPTG